MSELESPGSSGELYRYRGDEVPRTRPIFQGDIFRGIEIPGLDDGAGLAIIITHACSMRDGPALRARLVVARVVPRPNPIPLPWHGNFKLMPLPELIPGETPGHWAAIFEDVGTVPGNQLGLDKRVACLDDRGLVLLQQRQAHHLTRYVVETEILYEQSANVLTEAELLEDWLTAAFGDDAAAHDAGASQQATEFDSFIAANRNDLKDPSRRAAVRRSVRQEIERRFPKQTP